MTDVLCTITDRIAHIRFVRADQANALRPQTCEELVEIARILHRTPDLGAVVVSSDGPIFCAGGDLNEFSAADDLEAFVFDMATTFHIALDLFDQLDAPTIVAVEGNAGGAGVSIVAALDLAVVAETATFTMGYSAIGLTPDGSSSYHLARSIGLKRALDLALTNRTIDAPTACDWGLVTRIAPASDVLSEAMALAEQLAKRETVVLGETKRLLSDGTNRTLRDAMAHETEKVAWAASRPEVPANISAFMNRRSARKRR
jgi:2-(1,2-epoxy-1,2-dihydrophenyl)acetyl-CoA isomerase